MEKSNELNQAMINKQISHVYCVLDGKEAGVPAQELMDILKRFGGVGGGRANHKEDIINALSILEEGGQITSKGNKWYLVDTQAQDVPTTKPEVVKPKKESTMKTTNENTIQTIQAIIENLKSGTKTETLKKAKKDAAAIKVKLTSKTKKGAILCLQEELVCLKEVEAQKGTIIISTIPEPESNIKTATKTATKPIEKTRVAKSNENKIVAITAIIAGVQAISKSIDIDTLKSCKTKASDLLNTKAKKWLDNKVVFNLSEANNIKTKAGYKEHLQDVLLPELQRILAEETEIQEKDIIKVSIPQKAQMLKPDTAILIEQHDIKEKSRYDALYKMIGNQDTQIKELKDLINCHKNTIGIMFDRIANMTIQTPQKAGKKDVKDIKIEKTIEQIQAENREKYIKGLKGIDKILFSLGTKKSQSFMEFIMMDALDDFTKKQIKESLIKLNTQGLFKSVKGGYVLGLITDFIAPKESKKADKKEETKEVKSPTKKSFKRGSKFTRAMAIAQAITEITEELDIFGISDILKRQDKIYVQKGGKSSLLCDNTARRILKEKMVEGSIKKEGKKYHKA